MCVGLKVSHVQRRLDLFCVHYTCVQLQALHCFRDSNDCVGGQQSRLIRCLHSVDIWMVAFLFPDHSAVCFQLQFSNGPHQESAYKAVWKVFQRCNISPDTYLPFVSSVSVMVPLGFARCKQRVLCAFGSQIIAL